MTYDLMVIGAGPGGYVAAIKAAQLGLKVALVEKDRVGGTCLNRGCIPTKSLLHSADKIRKIRVADEDGIQVTDFNIDLDTIFNKKDQTVDTLVKGIESLVQANKIQLIRGQAKILSSSVIEINQEKYETKNVLIATGSVPAVPPIPGSDLKGVVTSNELLEKANHIKKLVIVGGGVIGVEFASIFSEFGCDVTILEAADFLLANFDHEISKKIAMQLKKQGIKIHTKAAVSEIVRDGSLLCKFTVKGKEQIVSGDLVLIATGRKASYEGLFDETLNLETDQHGICVNENFETSVEGIYAIGDVANRGTQLAHLASAQGVNAVLSMNNHPLTYQLDVVPACVYTHPEIASVGLTESEAKAKGLEVKVGKYLMSGNSKTVIAGSGQGFIKVVIEKNSEKIVGAQMMCDRATDMISEFSTAIVNQLTVNEIANIIHPHPTYSEGISEAYENLHGNAIHIMPRK